MSENKSELRENFNISLIKTTINNIITTIKTNKINSLTTSSNIYYTIKKMDSLLNNTTDSELDNLDKIRIAVAEEAEAAKKAAEEGSTGIKNDPGLGIKGPSIRICSRPSAQEHSILAPIFASRRSVWSRDPLGRLIELTPSQKSPARIKADLTWALALSTS